MNEDRRYLQELIIAELGVTPSFDPDLEIQRRLNFLTDQLRLSGASTYVLGISGGVDSSTAGRLCQLAVERVRADVGPVAGLPPARVAAQRTYFLKRSKRIT